MPKCFHNESCKLKIVKCEKGINQHLVKLKNQNYLKKKKKRSKEELQVRVQIVAKYICIYRCNYVNVKAYVIGCKQKLTVITMNVSISLNKFLMQLSIFMK